MKLTTHLHVLLSLKIHTALPPLFHIFSCCGAKHRDNFKLIPYKNMLSGWELEVTGLKLSNGRL
jgi:hypothetical protein